MPGRSSRMRRACRERARAVITEPRDVIKDLRPRVRRRRGVVRRVDQILGDARPGKHRADVGVVHRERLLLAQHVDAALGGPEGKEECGPVGEEADGQADEGACDGVAASRLKQILGWVVEGPVVSPWAGDAVVVPGATDGRWRARRA